MDTGPEKQPTLADLVSQMEDSRGYQVLNDEGRCLVTGAPEGQAVIMPGSWWKEYYEGMHAAFGV